MASARGQGGMTLIEMTVVVAIIALLVSFGLPAIRTLTESFASETSARSMISHALSSARAMALKNQRYVGVRFQKAYRIKDPLRPLAELFEAPQYMIFVMHEDPSRMGNLTIGFRAIEGLKPIRLPERIGAAAVGLAATDADVDEPIELNDVSSFTVVFSPAGKLVVHDVRVRNAQGVYMPNNDSGNPADAKFAIDEVFNSLHNISTHATGMFMQDDYPQWGLDKEPSRTSFVLYDRDALKRAYQLGAPWSQCLGPLALRPMYVSPYTGTIVQSD